MIVRTAPNPGTPDSTQRMHMPGVGGGGLGVLVGRAHGRCPVPELCRAAVCSVWVRPRSSSIRTWASSRR